MSLKRMRQQKILEIIEKNEVETQFQLLSLLRESGFNTTQATVSRDITEMRLEKKQGEGGRYRYAVPSANVLANYEAKLRTIFRESVTGVECAQNLVILKTLPGHASAACFALDGMEIDRLAGTLAGDDTAFIAMHDNDAAQSFCSEIKLMLE